MTSDHLPKHERRDDIESISELRQDLVSRDWIVVATGRSKRPHSFVSEKREKFNQPKEECPFEDPQASGNGDPLFVEYLDGHPANTPRDDGSFSGWSVQVIQNKFPAFSHGKCGVEVDIGPYVVSDGAGFHEVVITHDHTKSLARLPREQVEGVIRAYLSRYRSLREDECVKYISVFHNHGAQAGASLGHPHSQIIAIPVLPSNIRRSLLGSERYYYEHDKTCVYCVMLQYEKESGGDRIILENDLFLAVVPFVPRTAFEIRVYPKKHESSFAMMSDENIPAFTEIFHGSLNALSKALRDPAYNFFIHTAPVHEGRFDHYHWHIEILPKTQVWAGFELGTGVEISTIRPRDAANFLRQHMSL